MAEYLGLPTFDYSIINVSEDDEIPLASNNLAEPGPAFIARAEQGFPWGGGIDELADIANPEVISGLVVLDTWIRNCDRYRPTPAPIRMNRDNVFFSRQDSAQVGLLLKVIDHTHAFTCGGDLNRRLANIDATQDERVYGLFPEFVGRVERPSVEVYLGRLATLDPGAIDATINLVPEAWQVDRDASAALRTFLVERARFLTETLLDRIFPQERVN
jgi:hypothetical protein